MDYGKQMTRMKEEIRLAERMTRMKKNNCKKMMQSIGGQMEGATTTIH